MEFSTIGEDRIPRESMVDRMDRVDWTAVKRLLSKGKTVVFDHVADHDYENWEVVVFRELGQLNVALFHTRARPIDHCT